MNKDFIDFEKSIGYSFKDKKLLTQAFVHRSYLNENKGLNIPHNERLEFLGDAVLELVMTDYLFHKYKDKNEGEMTAYRAALVNTNTLSEASNEIGINKYLLLSKGEAKDTGRARQYILANTYESIVGALYLDGGYKMAKDFISKTLCSKADEVVEKRLWQDPKSYFQEKSQEVEGITPSYQVISESGPDHNKKFKVGLYLQERLIAEGEGHSKQEAEQEAAKAGLAKKGWR